MVTSVAMGNRNLPLRIWIAWHQKECGLLSFTRGTQSAVRLDVF
ncbi:UNVERIFIED_CONTAM: hypothetical protein GTU68_007035 [Idotea baltica]|nr:hypothetical protein [Idotea baltica]